MRQMATSMLATIAPTNSPHTAGLPTSATLAVKVLHSVVCCSRRRRLRPARSTLRFCRAFDDRFPLPDSASTCGGGPSNCESESSSASDGATLPYCCLLARVGLSQLMPCLELLHSCRGRSCRLSSSSCLELGLREACRERPAARPSAGAMARYARRARGWPGDAGHKDAAFPHWLLVGRR